MLSLCSFQLETATQRADLSLEGLGFSREMPVNLKLVEPQEECEKRIEEEILIVKESRSLPPAGDLLTRNLPAEFVGDAVEVTYSSPCTCSNFI